MTYENMGFAVVIVFWKYIFLNSISIIGRMPRKVFSQSSPFWIRYLIK